MRHFSFSAFGSAALLLLQTLTCAAESAPGPSTQARVASLVNPAAHCPDLRVTEDENAAVIVFLVNEVGVASRASVSISAGLPDLDDAALRCVPKLRFQPATRSGDGAPFDSWQRIGLKWARPSEHAGGGLGTAVATASVAQASAAPASSKPVAITAGAPSSQPNASPVQLRVCANDAGELTQDPRIVRSSGNPEIDAAAVRIAKAGSGSYRPAAQLNGRALSGCADLAITFETH